jgi:hypothetical protein
VQSVLGFSRWISGAFRSLFVVQYMRENCCHVGIRLGCGVDFGAVFRSLFVVHTCGETVPMWRLGCGVDFGALFS